MTRIGQVAPASKYFSGTSNLVLPVKNKSYFPPAFQTGTRLTYYASLFNSIEINSSFYRRPYPATMMKWSKEAPDDFRFSFKLGKQITHARKREFNLGPLKDFMSAINAMAGPGCLLAQFPPSFDADLPQLEALLRELKKYSWPVAIEFRHRSWYNDAAFALLSRFDAAMVIHDFQNVASPVVFTAVNHVYIRFHGPEAGYRGSYYDEYLLEFASRIRQWIEEGRTVYCYFNNTLGAAIPNLQTLNRFVEL